MHTEGQYNTVNISCYLKLIYFTAGVVRHMHSSKMDDSWYLYALLHTVECFTNEKQNPDQTLEILMTQLDPNVMQIFTKDQSVNSNQATQVSTKYLKLNNLVHYIHCFNIHTILGFWNIRTNTQYEN